MNNLSRTDGQEPKKIAFLVGVSKYFHKNMEDLNYADNDVEVIGAQLRILGFETTVITDQKANRANVTAEFDEFIGKASKLNKNDIVFVMFSGHGQQLLSRDPKKGVVAEAPYFCPHDAIPFDRNVHSLRGKSEEEIAKEMKLVSLNGVITMLDRKSNSTRNILVIDACRNNPAKGKSAINGNTVTDLRTGLSIVFAAKSGQKSWESNDPNIKHGVFSHFVIEGLKGKAANDFNQITWEGLLAHVITHLDKDRGKIAGGSDRIQSANPMGNITGSVVLGTMKKMVAPVVGGAFPQFEARFPTILAQTESPFREYMQARPNKLNSVKMVDVVETPEKDRIIMVAIVATKIKSGDEITARKIGGLQSIDAILQNKGVLVESLTKLSADERLIEEIKSSARGNVKPLPQVASWKSADGKTIHICFGKVFKKEVSPSKTVGTFRDFPGTFGKPAKGWVEKELGINKFTIAKPNLQIQGDFMLKFTVKSTDYAAGFGFKLKGKESDPIEFTGQLYNQYAWHYQASGKLVRIPFHRSFCTHYIIKRGREITIRIEQTTNPEREDPTIANLIVKEDTAFDEIELSTSSRKIEISSISVHDLSKPVSVKSFTPVRARINPYGKITPNWTVRTFKNSEFTIEKDELNLAGDFTIDFSVQTRKQNDAFAMKLLGSKGPDVTVGGLFHGSFSDGTNWVYRTPENLKMPKSVVHGLNNYRLTREGSMMTLEALNAIRTDTTVISQFPVKKENSFHGIQLSTYSKDIQFKSISVKKK